MTLATDSNMLTKAEAIIADSRRYLTASTELLPLVHNLNAAMLEGRKIALQEALAPGRLSVCSTKG